MRTGNEGEVEPAGRGNLFDVAQSESRLKWLQLEKMEREVAKLKAEVVELSRSPWRKPANVVPMVVGLVGLSGAMIQYIYSTNQLESARERFSIAAERYELSKQKYDSELRARAIELKAAEDDIAVKKKALDFTEAELNAKKQSYEEMLRLTSVKQIELQQAQEQLAKLQAGIKEAQAANGPTSQTNDRLTALAAEAERAAEQIGQQASRSLVYIQFRGALQRTLMRQLQNQLQKENYQAPGVERVAGEYGNEIRYFFPDDASTANNVATITNNFFAANGCPLVPRAAPQLVSAKGLTSPPPRGQIEIWVHHSCE